MKVNFMGTASMQLKSIIRKSITESLKTLGQKATNLEICVNFMSQEEIKELNNRTRNIDKVTDVLSYPAFSLLPGQLIDIKDEKLYYDGLIHLGDMALCLERATEQAQDYGTTLPEEVSKLAVHSTLHLMGYDHIKDCDFVIMQPKEDEIKTRLKAKKII